MGPIVEDAAVTAALNPGGKPFFTIPGTRMVPMAAASATADPLIPPKNMDAKILV